MSGFVLTEIFLYARDMNGFGHFAEEALEKGQQAVKQTVKQTQQAVASQVGTNQHLPTQTPQMPADMGNLPTDISSMANMQTPTELSQLEQNMHQQQQPGQTPNTHLPQPKGIPTSEQPKSPQDEERLKDVRKRLHQELHTRKYYEPLMAKIEQLKREHSTEARMQQQEQEEVQQQQLANLEEHKKQEDVALTRAKTNTEARNIGSG